MKSGIEEIFKDIKRGNIAPIYLLSGEEVFYIDQIEKTIDSTLLDETQKSFDYQVFYGKDSKVLDIISSAKQYPVLGEKRLVIVREAQQLKNIEKIADYFKSFSPQTCLLICYKGKNIDKRQSWYKQLPKTAVFVKSDKLYDNQATDWIHDFVKRRKRIISPKNIQLILEKTGTNLTIIYNELQKLFITIKEGEEITEKAIAFQIGILKDFSLFELQNSIIKKDAYKCQLIAKHFTKNPKNHPLTVTVSFLFGFFSKIIALHGLNNHSEMEIAKAIGVHKFFVKDYILAARSYNLKKCVKVLSFLREADIKSKGMKNVSTTDEDLLKELIFKIIHI
jgi:DNA polymerase-3 subunit delta